MKTLNKQERYEKRKNKRLKKSISDNAEYDNYEKVFTYEHLLESAKLCKQGVNWKASVQNYMSELHYNVYLVYQELMDRKFKIKTSYEFDIFERGKKRHIHSVHIRERVVQRCLCDYCLTPILSKTFIYDNCASQKGKGTSFALNRLKSHMQRFYREHNLDGYVLLFDFSDYFASIPHDTVMRLMRKYIFDEDILKLIELFLHTGETSDGLGLGLGNQISQIAALLVASPLDHMIKDKYGVKCYVRYMDDGIIIHHDKEFLKNLLKEMEKMANELGLQINHKKTKIISISKEFKFLKKKIRMDKNSRIYMRIIRQSITRMRRKLKRFYYKVNNGEMLIKDVEAAYQSWRSYALQYNSYNSVKSMDKLYDDLFINSWVNQKCEM